jgi:hypothetical protein
VSTHNPSMPEQVSLAVPGEELTRRAITVITAAIVAMALAFSVVNVTRLCLDLGVTAWIAWLIGPSVDLSVIGLLTGIRFLSLHNYTEEQLAKLHRFLRLCGALTLALNTAGALWHLQYGTASVDAIGPVLLIGWSETGPWLLREINAVCAPAVREPTATEGPQAWPAAAARSVVIPSGLLARTRELDAEHRAATGKPISRDNLRARLCIGRDRASALIAAVRAEAAAGARPVQLQQAA